MKDYYYKIIADFDVEDQWCLGDPKDAGGNSILPWKFTTGSLFPANGKLFIPLFSRGQPLSVTIASFGMPVLRKDLVSVVEGLTNECEYLPVEIEGQSDEYAIMNALVIKECVDEGRSLFKEYAENDPVRRDRSGKYKEFKKLVLERVAIGDSKIFRIKNSESDLIVSEVIKHALEKSGAYGVRYWQVYPEGVSDVNYLTGRE